MILQTIFAFISCVFFAIIFTAPKNELVYCGLAGGSGWFFYTLINSNNNQAVFATFVGALAVAAVSRILSHVRRAPSTLFLLPGILPLVPGSGMYYTMYGVLNGDMFSSYTKGVETFKLAGVIAIGIIVIFSLPRSFFSFIKLKDLEIKAVRH